MARRFSPRFGSYRMQLFKVLNRRPLPANEDAGDLFTQGVPNGLLPRK